MQISIFPMLGFWLTFSTMFYRLPQNELQWKKLCCNFAQVDPPDQIDYWPNIKIQFVGEMAAILNLAAILDFLI